MISENSLLKFHRGLDYSKKFNLYQSIRIKINVDILISQKRLTLDIGVCTKREENDVSISKCIMYRAIEILVA